MSLLIENSRDLLTKEVFKLKVLGYSPSGFGKTEFAATAPNPIFGLCDTGHGKGLLTIADKGLPYTKITTYNQLEEFCSGVGLEQYDTIVLDAFDFAADTFLKDHALTIPRTRGGESKKRAMGIPELDDYQSMAELERRCLAKLLGQPKHIYVNCAMDYYSPPDNEKAERIGGPSLPGAMRLGASAMFDVVLRLFIRDVLIDPKDAKSRIKQRVWQCEGDGKYLAKSRLKNGKQNVFPPEVVFDLEKGTGTFAWFLTEANKAYAATVVAAA